MGLLNPNAVFDARDEREILRVAREVLGAEPGADLEGDVDGVRVRLKVYRPLQRLPGQSPYACSITTRLSGPALHASLIQGRGFKVGYERLPRPLPSGRETFQLFALPKVLGERVFDDEVLGELEWLDDGNHKNELDLDTIGPVLTLRLGCTTDPAVLRRALGVVARIAKNNAAAIAALQAEGYALGPPAEEVSPAQLRAVVLGVAVVTVLVLVGGAAMVILTVFAAIVLPLVL